MYERLKPERTTIDEIEQHFGAQVQNVVGIEIGNSPGKKIKFKFRLSGKQYFAKELPHDSALLEKYHLLSQIRGTIPEAVIPTAVIASETGKIIAVSEYIHNGITLDAAYPELPAQKRRMAGMQVGYFMKRLHSSVLFSRSDEPVICDEQIRSVIARYVPAEQRDVFYRLICLRKNRCAKGPYSLIHRDVRPQNIILDKEDGIRIIDFENAELAPALYDLSSCLMLSHKYHDFQLGAIRGYFQNDVPDAFWMEEKQHLAWQLLEYASVYPNDSVSIERKFHMLCEYITSERLLPDWWPRRMEAGPAVHKICFHDAPE